MISHFFPVELHKMAASGQTPSFELEQIMQRMEQMVYRNLDDEEPSLCDGWDEEPTEDDSFSGTISASFHYNGTDLSLSVDVSNEDSMFNFLVMLFGAMTM